MVKTINNANSTNPKTIHKDQWTPIQLIVNPAKAGPKTEAICQVELLQVAAFGYTFLGTISAINEKKNITKQDALYLIQDAKQQILKSHLDIRILHIIVENYVYDNVEYKFLPLEKNCKKLSIDVKFVCFPKNLLKNFEQLFLKQQIFINQFICLNYVKTFNSNDNEKNICKLAKDIVKGANKQEVVSIPKIIKKTGFFEKLFHFFR